MINLHIYRTSNRVGFKVPASLPYDFGVLEWQTQLPDGYIVVVASVKWESHGNHERHHTIGSDFSEIVIRQPVPATTDQEVAKTYAASLKLIPEVMTRAEIFYR